MTAALANPHRIKGKRRRVRWCTSGRTVYAYVGNNPVSNVDPLGLCDKQKCSKLQKFAAQAAKPFDKFADATAQYSVAAGVLTVGAFAVEAPSAGLDTPVTAALGATTAGLGGFSLVQALWLARSRHTQAAGIFVTSEARPQALYWHVSGVHLRGLFRAEALQQS